MIHSWHDGLEALDRWITIKVGVITAAAVSGAGVINQDWVLAVIGGLAGIITILAGLAKAIREFAEIWKIRRDDRRAELEATRRHHLDMAGVPRSHKARHRDSD